MSISSEFELVWIRMIWRVPGMSMWIGAGVVDGTETGNDEADLQSVGGADPKDDQIPEPNQDQDQGQNQCPNLEE